MAVENPVVASCAYVIVCRAGSFLVRYAFKARADDERDFDCRAATDARIEAALLAASLDLEPMRRLRREAAGPAGMGGVCETTYRDLLHAAVRCGEDRPAEAREAARRLRILMIADACDRWLMSQHPGVELFHRAAIPGEEAFDGTLVGPQEAEALAIGFSRPGGVLARCLGRRDEARERD